MIIFREYLFYNALFGLGHSRNINIEPETDDLPLPGVYSQVPFLIFRAVNYISNLGRKKYILIHNYSLGRTP